MCNDLKPIQQTCTMSRAVASGVKGGDDYRAHGWGGAPQRSQRTAWGQLKKMLRTIDGPLLCIFMKAYHLHVFLSIANLKIQKSLKHSNTRRGKAKLSSLLTRHVRCTRREARLTYSKTEPSSPSPPPAPEQTNKNRSLNMQTKKDVKEPNSARCSVCTERTQRDISNRLNTKFDFYCSCTDKIVS